LTNVAAEVLLGYVAAVLGLEQFDRGAHGGQVLGNGRIGGAGRSAAHFWDRDCGDDRNDHDNNDQFDKSKTRWMTT